MWGWLSTHPPQLSKIPPAFCTLRRWIQKWQIRSTIACSSFCVGPTPGPGGRGQITQCWHRWAKWQGRASTSQLQSHGEQGSLVEGLPRGVTARLSTESNLATTWSLLLCMPTPAPSPSPAVELLRILLPHDVKSVSNRGILGSPGHMRSEAASFISTEPSLSLTLQFGSDTSHILFFFFRSTFFSCNSHHCVHFWFPCVAAPLPSTFLFCPPPASACLTPTSSHPPHAPLHWPHQWRSSYWWFERGLGHSFLQFVGVSPPQTIDPCVPPYSSLNPWGSSPDSVPHTLRMVWRQVSTEPWVPNGPPLSSQIHRFPGFLCPGSVDPPSPKQWKGRVFSHGSHGPILRSDSYWPFSPHCHCHGGWKFPMCVRI